VYLSINPKIGYFIYVAGAAMPILYFMILALVNELDPMTSFLGLILRYTFNVAFIIMYGTQLYVMKPLTNKKTIELY